MRVSELYNTICRGKWFILPSLVDANRMLVQRLMKREVRAEEEQEGRGALRMRIYGRAMERSESATFDELPEESTVVVPLHGTMTKYNTWCSYGTQHIASLVQAAAESPRVKSIVLDIDSGGGSVDAIAPMLDAIAECKRRRKGCVAAVDLCASAAYYVACHTDGIVAMNRVSSELGSIGVMMQFYDYAKYYEKEGITQHRIYSTLSDYKNAPFEAALKGDYTKIRSEELDPLARQFQMAVKKCRPKLKADTEGILSGRMFYADDAVTLGLADEVGTLERAVSLSRAKSDEYLLQAYYNE